MNRNDQNTLEELIDLYGINGVMDAIAEIASEKEDHVLTNWQDRDLGKYWATVRNKSCQLTTFLCKRYRAAITGPFYGRP